MGALHYGPVSYAVDDDTLRHFMPVVVAKLRRQESFLALVRVGDDLVERIWLHPGSDIRFETAPSDARLDPARLDAMIHEANRPGGLDLCVAWAPDRAGIRR